ncbi:MAG: helix-turn-helix domain-containing protein [Actinobacteria bacterium]|nr:helix-turn-helix domain-containing protein [Actinomycetota bacterium]
MAVRRQETGNRGMVSLAEAAELAGLSIRTLRRRIADGELPAYRTGPRLIRVHPDDLATLVVPMNAAAAEQLNGRIPTSDSSGPSRVSSTGRHSSAGRR